MVLLVVGAFVVFGPHAPSWQQNEAGRAAAAYRDLARAATGLAELPAARYTGALVGETVGNIPVEITITSDGSAKATLTVGAEKVEAIALPPPTRSPASGCSG
jgi:hypothetical protein